VAIVLVENSLFWFWRRVRVLTNTDLLLGMTERGDVKE
jgi:hypothetical protein